MKKRVFRDHKELLMEDLQNPDVAAAYLNIALGDEDPRMFLVALRNVYEARGINMTQLAQDTSISRENLYRILSKTGNPKLTNLKSLLNAAGVTLTAQLSKR